MVPMVPIFQSCPHRPTTNCIEPKTFIIHLQLPRIQRQKDQQNVHKVLEKGEHPTLLLITALPIQITPLIQLQRQHPV